MSEPTLQESVNALAELAGVPAPDLRRQGPVGVATAKVGLTKLAIQANATWQQIADAYGHGNPRVAKRDHQRLEKELQAQLRMRQNAN